LETYQRTGTWLEKKHSVNLKLVKDSNIEAPCQILRIMKRVENQNQNIALWLLAKDLAAK
jgi:hypothetical protein